MRWFFTDECDLMHALSDAGEVIANGPGSYWSDFVSYADEDYEPLDYPLKRLLRSSRADALVAVTHLKTVAGVTAGFPKSAVLGWSGLIRGRHTVAYDPSGTSYKISKTRGPRGCTCRVHNFHVYITDNEKAAISVASSVRTVMWEEGQPVNTVIEIIGRSLSGSYPQKGHGLRPYLSEQ